jgi:transcriptional regulator with XRE-family HTH domain
MSAAELAEFLHRRIRSLGLTKTEVARRAGLSRETLNKLLRGEVDHPGPPTLMQLARALQVAPLYLLRVAYGGTAIPIDTAARARHPGDHGSFVRDVTFPDNALVTVDQEFDKVWELQNTGNVPWRGRAMKCVDDPVLITLDDGDAAMRQAAVMLVPMQWQVPLADTEPGATVRISVRFKAPSLPCTTISRWKMVDADGAFCMPGLSGIWCLVNVVAL